VKQPDLNWRNPSVRQAMYDVLRFWFDRGVDGFRIDVLPFISKDTTYPPLPEKYHGNFVRFYEQGPHLHEYVREMHDQVLSKYDSMSVGEGPGVDSVDVHDFVDPDRKELNMIYHFEGTDFGYLPGKHKIPDPKGWSLPEMKKVYSKWDATFEEKGWGTIYLGNHDQPRMTTRWGNDSPEFRAYSSKMLTTFLLTMRATPYYYMGDELGMTNIKFDKIEDYRDLETINWYKGYLQKGDTASAKELLEGHKISARDNGRTPFQWDDSPNAGFTTGTPWLKINPNHTTVNVAAEEKDPNSCLHYFREMVRLRKSTPALIYGRYTLLDAENPDVYSYTRELNGQKLLVMLNFHNTAAAAKTGISVAKAKVLIGNYGKPSTDGKLRPYEAVVYQVK